MEVIFCLITNVYFDRVFCLFTKRGTPSNAGRYIRCFIKLHEKINNKLNKCNEINVQRLVTRAAH